jgi:SsrA-binding protein
MAETPTIQNRKARFEFQIIDSFEAGIVLQGTEVKSVRKGNVGFTDSFAFMKDGEVWLKDMYIKEFEHGSYNNHEPLRLRKLLLNKTEIRKIDKALSQKGYTLVPLKLYFKKGRAKIEMGIGVGKKLHDKRQSMVERDAKREIDREMKSNR